MNVDELVFVGLRGYSLALDRSSGEVVWTWAAPRMSATWIYFANSRRRASGWPGSTVTFSV